MRVDVLKKYLNTLPEDMEVFIQTVPDDFASPVSFEKMEIWPATKDERGGTLIGINPAKLVLTAHNPKD